MGVSRFDAQQLAEQLPDVGEGLMAAAIDLSNYPSPDRCEAFAARLNGVARFSMELRAALIRESKPNQSQAA